MADPIHILVTGGTGQIGLEIVAADWPEGVVLHTPTRQELNLEDIRSVERAFAGKRFAAVINSGAYTAVDKAEDDIAAAFAANAMGPAILAQVTRTAGIPLIQISTDYVFDGGKAHAYSEDDPVRPLGVYGASKLAGELAVRSGNLRSVVLRTAWVLSVHRSNFLKTMLRLATDRSSVSVVGDQFGSPTSAKDIAAVIRVITMRMISDISAPVGLYHFVNTGETSWAGLAQNIFNRSQALGGPSATVESITTAQYPTPARRPSNSRLRTEKLSRDYNVMSRPWEDAVSEIVVALQAERAVR